MTKGLASRPHIGIFGRRNIGKSSFINSLVNQEIAIVSDHAGTTTDPVKKTIEIGGIGPVILIDTAGIDDTGELGEKRIAKSLDVLKTIDLGVLLLSENTFGTYELGLVQKFQDLSVPFIIIHNKSDKEKLLEETKHAIAKITDASIYEYCALHSTNTHQIIEALRTAIPESAFKASSMVGDLISYGDLVVLITPIDIEAPEGRLILPQVQAIRDILDNDGVAVVLKEREIDTLLQRLRPKPALVITDSQVFLKADAAIPKDIPLTSFSILLARQRGDFANYLKGTPHIANLKDGDRVLLLESCTHHVSCDDIGRIKIPRWLSNYCGKSLEYEIVSGLNNLPRPITDYALVIQCGGCVITRKQIINRLKPAVDAGIPVTNYGMAIAWVHGIYQRAVQPFVQIERDNLHYL
jgi:[FeFe] hydrogenase H-cluster maturation GTPase HydF